MSTSEYTALPDGFTPGDKDVIVGRGKVCYQHSGNKNLIQIVQSVLQTYCAADATKKSKSELIKSIMVQIREAASPTGGFVKFDSEKGQWFEVGDRIAREKVSQTFRDALNDRYKSSTTSKTLKRRQERINRKVSSSSTKAGKEAASTAAAKPAIEPQELPAAQARVDALLMAANASGSIMPTHPALSNLAPMAPGMSAFLRPTGFLPAPRHGLGASFSTLPSMTPALSNLMAGKAAQTAAAFNPSAYGQLFLSRRQGQIQGQLQGQLSNPFMLPLYHPPSANPEP